MRKLRRLWLVVGLSLLMSGCSQARALSFDVLAEKAPFVTSETGNQSPPDFIVIASPDDLASPAAGVQYSETMLAALKEVDFRQQFVVLHLVGQIADNGKISAVARSSATVRIKLSSYSVGPGGQYLLPGFTLPYQMTRIDKGNRDWGQNIHFVLEVDKGDPIAEAEHFIP